MIYRSADEALRRRRDELIARRQLEMDTLPDAIPAVYVRRRARIMAGAAGITCAVFMTLCAALRREGLTTILHMSWVCMAAVYLFTRETARHQVRTLLERVFAPTGSVLDDVDRLEGLSPARVIKDLADRIEWRSVALPMTALALLLPLSLHYLVVTTLNVGLPDGRDFDGWISLSLLFVGHCHVVLSYQAWRFARQIRDAGDVFTVGLIADRSGWQAWGLTIVSSMVAGILLLVVVPIAGIALVIVAPAVVAATGLVFIPSMFARMGKKIREERLLLVYPCRAG